MNKLVVKNRNMYISGSTALAPEREYDRPLRKEEYEKLRKAKALRINRAKQKKNAKKRKVMFNIASVFIIGFSIVWGEAQVYGTQQKLTSIKTQIIEINKENEDYKHQLAKVGSIENIKQVAEKDIHMITPDRTLIISADLEKNNFNLTQPFARSCTKKYL